MLTPGMKLVATGRMHGHRLGGLGVVNELRGGDGCQHNCDVMSTSCDRMSTSCEDRM